MYIVLQFYMYNTFPCINKISYMYRHVYLVFDIHMAHNNGNDSKQ